MDLEETRSRRHGAKTQSLLCHPPRLFGPGSSPSSETHLCVPSLRNWVSMKPSIWTKDSPAGVARRGKARQATPGPARHPKFVVFRQLEAKAASEQASKERNTKWGPKPWIWPKVGPAGLAQRGGAHCATPGPPGPGISRCSTTNLVSCSLLCVVLFRFVLSRFV